jgi:hypothetical protein
MTNSSTENNQKPVDIISGRVLLGLIGLLAFLLPILLFFVSIIIVMKYNQLSLHIIIPVRVMPWWV